MALNMACVDISIEDLVGCSFGLSRQEVAAFMCLLGSKGWISVVGLSSCMKRDRSVVQRGLSSLLRKGLIEREQANKEGGGYEYLYRAKDKTQIKKAILAKSRAFSRMVQETTRGW
jgi:predicted transcriptional regulator